MLSTTTFPLSDRINALEESQTIGMAKKARELASQGHKVINLSLGEPDFTTPAHIKQAAIRAMEEGYTFYTPIAGYADLRKAIAEKLVAENNIQASAENIIVSTGAKQSIANAVMCLINPGDEVLILGPYWVSYLEIVKLAEGIPVILNGSLANDFKPSTQEIEASINERTKLIMFSSPCNPTGSVFSKEELHGIAQIMQRNQQLFVLADEIYEYINFEEKPFSIGSISSVADRVLTVNGFSKGFAMTGWRVGYLCAPKWMVAACDKMQGQFTSGTCSIAQRAALEAIASDKTPSQEMTKAFLRRRNLVLTLLQNIPGMKCNQPKGAFYVFPDVTAYFGKSAAEHQINNATDLCNYLLQKAFVSLVPGEAFGEPKCLRISYAAADEDLTEAMARIKTALAELK